MDDKETEREDELDLSCSGYDTVERYLGNGNKISGP
jgi:hypothetical protein